MPAARVSVTALTALGVWGLDRWTKILAVRHLHENESLDVLGSWFALTLHRNTGAAFGMAAHAPQALTAFATALTAFLAFCWFRAAKAPSRGVEAFALALILGGSAGNLTDRFTAGAVIDFLDFKVWPIFNAADIAITVGAAVWAGCVLFGRRGAGAEPAKTAR